MSRRRILEDTLARLEAERYLPPVKAPGLKPWTPEEQAANRHILLEALGVPVDDPEWQESHRP